jgi:hypothetical protein
MESRPGRIRGPQPQLSIMPSLIRFLTFLGLLAAIAYAGMFALVGFVEPTQREFVVMVPPEHMGKVAGPARPRRNTETAVKDRLQAVEPNRLARTIESLQIPR